MTSITANPRWYFHCHASEAQSLGRQCDNSQLDAISLSAAQLRQSSHLKHDGLQTQQEDRFKQNVTVVPSSYLASTAWAKLQRQFETAEASFPGKDTKKIHVRQGAKQGRTRKMGGKIFLPKKDTFNHRPYQRVTSCVWWALRAYKRGWIWGMKSEGC